MAKGSCNCGEYKHEYSGEPVAVAICHCIPCIKTAGQNGSLNTLVKTDNLRPDSIPSTHTLRRESGKNVTYDICNTCGTIMTVRAEAMEGLTVFKTGTLDDPAEVEKHNKPVQEIFTRNRPSWCDAFPGCEQEEGQ
ncbi:hypothetical protein EJ03DRAFT_325235 [Teratosphaeria nubilosa]|uniref:CENP-V/GFA domain-containing protein n=1 Tax=Teratosphaeria nubilosa TaxID=161662 RepID=A0A6G1LGK2_9PEZI|nr:hypothetical protein EJ03DRAFT_325235 [Teratosphaeria nubilosa]